MDNYTIENLVATLKQADHEYYNLGNSKFTDASYDNLKDILKLKDPNNRYFLSIGAPVIKSKVSLPYYMGSLDKIKDISKIKNWISNYPIIISDKLDNDMITENIYHDIFGEKVSNYMEKVLKYLVSDTYIKEMSDGTIMIKVPFSDSQFSRIRHFNVGFFIDYCKNNYGLTRKESEYLWGDYLNEMDYIVKYEYGIKDPVYH